MTGEAMLELTRQEKQVIVFLMASALLGVGIIAYKNLKSQPDIEIISSRQIEKDIKNSKIININTAPEDELVKLRGIGPALAKAIVEYRIKQGAFISKEELKNIKGIGQSKYENIKDNIKIE